MKNRTFAILISITLLLLLSGCSMHKDIEKVSTEKMLPNSFSLDGKLEVDGQWWELFQDEQLDALVTEALGDNLTVRGAWTRLQHAKALVKMVGSGKMPQVNASASVGRTHYGVQGFNMNTFTPAETIDQFGGNLSIAYQLDLWQKIDSQFQAEMIGMMASRMDVSATAISIASAVVDLYFNIAEQQAVVKLLEYQLKLNQDYLNLVEFRFAQGAASAVDVNQQRLQVQNAKNQFPPVEMTMALLNNQLAVLLGKSPDSSFELGQISLPALPALPATGIAADVLRKRPDVMAAELRIYAADKRVAVAVADRFPTLSISAAGGSNSNAFSDILDRWFVNLAGNLVAPLFDGGRRKAEVERNQALVQGALAQWKGTVLNAFLEVENALENEQGQKVILQGVNSQLALAAETLEMAKRRYVNGLTNYLTVLTNLQGLQNLERSEISLQRQLLSSRVKLMTALGGSWTENLNNPFLTTAQESDGETEQ
jgi:multidrug efflux system outer membrane protein